jgi:hypothetical protein
MALAIETSKRLSMSALAVLPPPTEEFKDDETQAHVAAARQLRHDGKYDDAIRRYEEAIGVRESQAPLLPKHG